MMKAFWGFVLVDGAAVTHDQSLSGYPNFDNP